MSSPTNVHGTTSLPWPSTMTAVTARTYGGPEVLATEALAVPAPQAGELLVAVRASSLNALDWHFLTGTPYLMRLMFGMRRPKRFVRGADVAGVVVGVGDGVTRFAIGDAVFGETPGGGCGQYLTVKETGVVAIPEGVSFEAAGATPVAGLTALQVFNVYNNQLTGSIPALSGLAALQVFLVKGNQLTGSVPALAGLTALYIFDVSHNQLSGPMPALAGLAGLGYFYASDNQFSGSLPALAGLSALQDFYADANQLTGPIPPLAGLAALHHLLVHHNQLSGSLPSPAGLTAPESFHAHENHRHERQCL